MNLPDRTVVAIHQPNFFPWLPFFEKVLRADVFVLMDNVQLPRTGAGSWLNRVKLRVAGKPAWWTVPLDRGASSTPLVNEVRLDPGGAWRGKLLRTVEMNYARAPFFRALLPGLRERLQDPTESLAEFNERNLRWVLQLLDISTRLVPGTSLRSTGASTDLLISMVKAAGGTTYLSGRGARAYQVDARFAQEGLELVYQDYAAPAYPQAGGGEFIPGLSVLDALFSVGPEGTRALLDAHGGAGAA